jgi:hypothetical protein
MGYMKKWKDLIQKKWMVWACKPNEVYYVFGGRNYCTFGRVSTNFKWETIDNHDDVGDTLYFDDKKEVQSFINYCIANNKIPKGCERLEYCLVVPTYEDNHLWYETAGTTYTRHLKETKHVG